MEDLKFLKKSIIGTILAITTYSQVCAEEIDCPENTPTGTGCYRYSCGENCTATLINGAMTIEGTGKMTDFTKSTGNTPRPWESERNKITSLNISEGITSIGNWGFNDTPNLTDINLPSTLTKIGNISFLSCGVQNINLPASVTEIGSQAFQSSSIANINIPEGVTSIKTYAFWNTQNLGNIVLSSSVASIGNQAFDKSAATIYCTKQQIDNGVCDASKLGRRCVNNVCTNYTANDIVHYEQEGNHYNVYDSNGNIVAQYKNAADFGTTRTYQRRTSYSPAEAAQHVNHTNNNRVIFTFK